MTRYRTYEKAGEKVRLPCQVGDSTSDPDSDGSHEMMLKEGWNCTHVDPIPGVEMVSRPLGFYIGRW